MTGLFFSIVAVAMVQQPVDKPTTETVHPYKIESETDRVRGRFARSVRFPEILRDDSDGLSVSLRISRSRPVDSTAPAADGDLVYIGFTSSSDTWEFLKSHSVSMLAGATRFKPRDVEHDGEIKKGYVLETVSGFISFAELKLMGDAQSLEIALGSRDITLTDRQVAALKDLAIRLAASNEEADRIDGEHLLLLRKRAEELQAELDRAVDKARAYVKTLPRDRRQQAGIAKMMEEFRDAGRRYRPTPDEFKELLKKYPEFNDAAPEPTRRR